MITTEQAQARTRGFARVLGPFYAVVGTVVAARTAEIPTLLTEFFSSAVWPWITGAFLLMGSCAMIAFHQYWHGAAAVIVSLLGWGMTLKGFFLLAFPHAYASLSNRVIGSMPMWQGVYLLVALMGLYLALVGWVSVSHRRSLQPKSGSTTLPRAA